jgi:nucleoside-diphosphate-sugar epimerase
VEDVGVALVTGSGGVVGRALVAALRARGERVVALRRADGDAGDPAFLAGIVAREEIHTIFHLAAQNVPGDDMSINLLGTRAALDAGAARVVVAGTLGVYGHQEGALGEDLELVPTTSYERTKTLADILARERGAVVARLANVYGPGDRHAWRLIPELLRAARAGTPPRMRSDGTPRRDFLHADDAARALLALATDGEPGNAYNVGAGVPIAVRTVVETLEAALGRPLHAQYAPGAHDGTSRHADVARVNAATGWRPEIGLADGLRALVA